jgi:2,3-bisphosphoglycerate-dependent phosphoglycerate mutase
MDIADCRLPIARRQAARCAYNRKLAIANRHFQADPKTSNFSTPVICYAAISFQSASFKTMTKNQRSQALLLVIIGSFALTVTFAGSSLSGSFAAHQGAQPKTIILVRHAEKMVVPPENKDPDISAQGEARAKEIARMFAGSGITAIYATQFKRTEQTVKPLAERLRVPVTVVEAKKTSDLVSQIRARGAGETIFIAGHNNTVPEIIAALGGPSFPIIPETDFDNLYILTIQGDGVTKLVKLKFGSPLPVSGQEMTKP